MNEPLEKYVRMGIVHFMAFPAVAPGTGPWEETVREIALDTFFQALEITHIEDPGVRERVKKIIEAAGLSVGFGAHPAILGKKYDLNALDEKERAQAVEAMKALIDEAIFMGAESFVVLSGKDPGPDKRVLATEALIKSFEELCRYSAKNSGPIIVAETFDCEVDKCCLLGPTPLAQTVARKVREKYPNFGLLVDLSHIPLLKESPREALVPVKDYLTGVHIGNAVINPACPGYGDYHPIFGTPGSANSVGEVADFLKTLLEIGFLNSRRRPIVSFEIKPMEGQDPLVIIANAKRVMKEAWARI